MRAVRLVGADGGRRGGAGNERDPVLVAAKGRKLRILLAIAPQHAVKIGVRLVHAGVDDGHDHVLQTGVRFLRSGLPVAGCGGFLPGAVADVDRIFGSHAAHRAVVGHPPLKRRHVRRRCPGVSFGVGVRVGTGAGVGDGRPRPLGIGVASAAGRCRVLGIRPPTPDWSVMISDARLDYRTAPHLILVPGLCIFLLLLSINLLGDALRDHFDVRSREVKDL